jgi:hypothetical protein
MDKTDQQLITQQTIDAMRAQQALAILDAIQDHLTPSVSLEVWRNSDGFHISLCPAIALGHPFTHRGVSLQDALAQLAQSLVE